MITGRTAEAARAVKTQNDKNINVVCLRRAVAVRPEPDPKHGAELGTVIPFSQGRIGSGRRVGVRHGDGRGHDPHPDRAVRQSYLADADEYRGRMLVNLLAFVALLGLVVTGSWAFGAIIKTTGNPHLLTCLASPLHCA